MTNTLITKKGRNQKHDIVEEIHSYNICLDTREVYLCGEPGEDNSDSGTDFRMANRFLKNVRLLEAAGDDPIIVHQHNLGGDWQSGMMIYDIISHCACHIILVMHGEACSMGSIIPQAADTRIIMPNCLFLVHDGEDDIAGTHKQVQSAAQLGEKMRERMLDIFSNVCGNGHYFLKEQSEEKDIKIYIINKMQQKEDWWLFAREVVAYGFADAVLGDEGYENIDVIKDNIVNDSE